jgi:biotin carboxyl carrier protein
VTNSWVCGYCSASVQSNDRPKEGVCPMSPNVWLSNGHWWQHAGAISNAPSFAPAAPGGLDALFAFLNADSLAIARAELGRERESAEEDDDDIEIEPVVACRKAAATQNDGVALVLEDMMGLEQEYAHATVTKVLVAVGDVVARGQLLVELESTAWIMDFEAPCDGRVSSVLPLGAVVGKGCRIAVIS